MGEEKAMLTVNMLEAKSTLSRLVEAVELGHVKEVIIARNGRPAARLVQISEPRSQQRLGVAKGKFDVPNSIDNMNSKIAKLFSGRESF
mgnify:FL=1